MVVAISMIILMMMMMMLLMMISMMVFIIIMIQTLVTRYLTYESVEIIISEGSIT